MLLGTATYLHLTTSEPEGQGELVRIQAARLPLLPTPSPQPAAPPDRRQGTPPQPSDSAAPAARANQAATPCKLERLVRPARRLTLAQARLLDLSHAQLEAAPTLDEALADLLDRGPGPPGARSPEPGPDADERRQWWFYEGPAPRPFFSRPLLRGRCSRSAKSLSRPEALLLTRRSCS